MKKIIFWAGITLFFLFLTLFNNEKSVEKKQFNIDRLCRSFQKLESLPPDTFDSLARYNILILQNQKHHVDSIFSIKDWQDYKRVLNKKFLRKLFNAYKNYKNFITAHDSSQFNDFLLSAKFYILSQMNEDMRKKLIWKRVWESPKKQIDSIKHEFPELFNHRLKSYHPDLEKLKWFLILYPTPGTSE